VINGYKYQSDFARYWYSLGYKIGLEEVREARLRSMLIELLGARLPGLRDELASRIHDQPVEWVARVFAELYHEHDEDKVRAALATAPGPVRREDPDFSKPGVGVTFVDDGTGPDWT